MKTPRKSKVKNSGAYFSPRALVTLTKSGVTSFAELRETISFMLLFLQMKQPHGSRLAAEVSISIYRESVKTDSTTQSSGTQQSGLSAMKEEGSCVQTILPLIYPTSGRKRKNSGLK